MTSVQVFEGDGLEIDCHRLWRDKQDISLLMYTMGTIYGQRTLLVEGIDFIKTYGHLTAHFREKVALVWDHLWNMPILRNEMDLNPNTVFAYHGHYTLINWMISLNAQPKIYNGKCRINTKSRLEHAYRELYLNMSYLANLVVK